MTQIDDTSGLHEFRPAVDAPAPDVFDQALSDILAKDNPYSYPILSAIQRTLRQNRLANHYEAHEILHEAYLRGKKKLQAGEAIYNPYAWLRATAVNVIHERRRKHRATTTDPQIMEAVLPDPRWNLMQQQILSNEIDLLYEALAVLYQEDPEGTCLIYLRHIQAQPWSQIAQWLAAEGQPVPNDAALRQRASRARRRLRAILVQRQMPCGLS